MSEDEERGSGVSSTTGWQQREVRTCRSASTMTSSRRFEEKMHPTDCSAFTLTGTSCRELPHKETCDVTSLCSDWPVSSP